jgi:hypothetical protein
MERSQRKDGQNSARKTWVGPQDFWEDQDWETNRRVKRETGKCPPRDQKIYLALKYKNDGDDDDGSATYVFILKNDQKEKNDKQWSP